MSHLRPRTAFRGALACAVGMVSVAALWCLPWGGPGLADAALAAGRTDSPGTVRNGAATGSDRVEDLVSARIDIQLTAASVAALREAPRKSVTGIVRLGGRGFDGVRVHLKGRGSFQSVDVKPNWTLEFPEPGAGFQGLTKVHLNNSAEDPSYLNESLGRVLCMAAGIAVPRVAHAWVTLNGRALGLYVMKEGFTEDFMRRGWGGESGALYEPVPGADVDGDLVLRCGAPVAGALPTGAAGRGEGAVGGSLGPWAPPQARVDVDRLLALMAVEVMSGHWDGYATARNNFRVHVARSGAVTLVPSGMDQLFANASAPWRPEMTGLLARTAIGTQEGRAAYDTSFRELYERCFDVERLTGHARRTLAGLRTLVPGRDYRELCAEQAVVCDRIRRRGAELRRQLDQPPAFRLAVREAVGLRLPWQPDPGSEPATAAGGGGAEGREGILFLEAGVEGGSTWTGSARMHPGRYRVSGQARVEEVAPLPFGRSAGARLRVLGAGEGDDGLVGTRDWSRVASTFEVHGDGEREVHFRWELRATRGRAWFDARSVRLERIADL